MPRPRRGPFLAPILRPVLLPFSDRKTNPRHHYSGRIHRRAAPQAFTQPPLLPSTENGKRAAPPSTRPTVTGGPPP